MITTILDNGSAITAGRRHREPLAASFKPGQSIIAWSDTNDANRPAGVTNHDPRVVVVDTGGPNGLHYGMPAESLLLAETIA